MEIIANLQKFLEQMTLSANEAKIHLLRKAKLDLKEQLAAKKQVNEK